VHRLFEIGKFLLTLLAACEVIAIICARFLLRQLVVEQC
jgi:hypothetical protein